MDLSESSLVTSQVKGHYELTSPARPWSPRLLGESWDVPIQWVSTHTPRAPPMPTHPRGPSAPGWKNSAVCPATQGYGKRGEGEWKREGEGQLCTLKAPWPLKVAHPEKAKSDFRCPEAQGLLWPGHHFQQAGEAKKLKFSVTMSPGQICGDRLYHTPMLIRPARFMCPCVKNFFPPFHI